MSHPKIELLDGATLRVDNTTLTPWPGFHITGGDDQTPGLVAKLLLSDDPLAMLWRAKIPNELLIEIQRYPSKIWGDLLDFSQLHPKHFLQLSRSCPAMIAVHVYHDFLDDFDRHLCYLTTLQRGWRDSMKMFELPSTREVFRILSKCATEDCLPVQINQLLLAIREPRKRKLLRHLSVITPETLDTLRLPTSCMDLNLLCMQSYFNMPMEANSVRRVCEDIMDHRRSLSLLPYWPYKGSRICLSRLINILSELEVRLAMGHDCKKQALPKPPLEGLQSSKVQIEPLQTVGSLFEEGREMQNCITTYTRSIVSGLQYAYRMTFPERATLLLTRRDADWFPVEIRTVNNGYADAHTVDLVHAWAGTKIEKETNNDFPF